MSSIELRIKTARRKLVKERYFKVNSRNPFQYCPISDESLKLAPHTLNKVLDMIINILEKEYDGDIVWEKII